MEEPLSADEQSRVLLVVGGLPGSGKTTLVRRLLAQEVSGVRGYDSEQVTERLRRAGVRLPYRVLRPCVHAWHRLRVLRGIRGGTPVVVLTDPWTSARWRTTVQEAARDAGRRVRLVLLDASREQAEQGQAARGRALSARAMRRHAVRWASARPSLVGTEHVTTVDREAAARLTLEELITG
ncbi:AAA family ATPase [Modestobacter sp. I12A-02662]|uniref:AAA family ATPase n=1 Tax=Modestobacter sp. I12A-02662 TaxID=1730496 RepID=UPI0034DFA902